MQTQIIASASARNTSGREAQSSNENNSTSQMPTHTTTNEDSEKCDDEESEESNSDEIDTEESDDEEIEKSNEEGEKSDMEESDKSDMEKNENELCIVCGKGEDDDHAVETWVLCDQCNNWMHEKCVPLDHIYDVNDNDFVYHNCLWLFLYTVSHIWQIITFICIILCALHLQ